MEQGSKLELEGVFIINMKFQIEWSWSRAGLRFSGAPGSPFLGAPQKSMMSKKINIAIGNLTTQAINLQKN
jgi:hypothetical protein